MKKSKSELAKTKREYRTKKRIYEMIKDRNALFITMTFNDETLQRTSAETRRLYIKRYLKEETAIYIANIDYGKKGDREHYHAIAITSTLKKRILERYKGLLYKLNFKAYKYGEIKAEYIGSKYRFKNEDEIRQTAEYLKNHIYKETTKGNKPIFSREIPSDQEQRKRLKRFYLMEEEQRQKKALLMTDEEYIKAVIDETDSEIMKSAEELGLKIADEESEKEQQEQEQDFISWWKVNKKGHFFSH